MTELEAKRIVTFLAAAYPNWRPGEAGMALYERLLAPLPSSAAETAVLELVASAREFAPPAGAIVTRVAELEAARAGHPGSAEEAWAEVQGAVRALGSYRCPRFESPALSRAVAALSWGELCLNPNREATRAHFFRLFERFAARDLNQRLGQLLGPERSHRLLEDWAGAAVASVLSART